LQWKQRFAGQFAELYNDWLPRTVTAREAIELLRIPYVPYWSFGEQLPGIHEGTTDPSSLGHAYEILALVLAGRLNWDEAITAASRLHELDEIWLTKHRVAATERLIASGLPGFMEVCHFCSDTLIERPQQELLSAARQAQVPLSGWPIGIVLEDEDVRPRPTNEGILAVVSIPVSFGRRFDYWTLSRGGDFYTLRSLSEDDLHEDRAGKGIYFDVRIARATEVLLHCANLYKALGVDPNAQIELQTRYGGLKGRTLGASPRRDIRPRTNVHENEVSVDPVRFRLGTVEDQIVELVS